MKQTIARYAVTFGLTGCYMPDSHDGAFEFTRRKDLANFIKSELDVYELPQSLFADVHITRLWRFIKKNGSSVAHFSLRHGPNALEFHGLTEDEYLQQSEQE